MKLSIDNNKSIDHILRECESNKFVLPGFQRGYVWEKRKIEKLFDSIFRGYPVGTLLCWKIEQQFVNNYKDNFYEIVDHQTEAEKKVKSELFKTPGTQNDYIAVLDGQQRVTSVIIGIKGYYENKKGEHEKLYFNIFPNDEEEYFDDENTAFKFFSENKVVDDDKHMWIRLDCCYKKEEEFQTYITQFLIDKEVKDEKIKTRIYSRAFSLRHKIFNEVVFNIFEVVTGDFDEALETFVRLNNQGEELSKADLLFANIQAGYTNFRTWVESLINEINDYGDGFKFKIDFILKCFTACLKHTVKFKYNTFNKNSEDFSKVDKEKDNISAAICYTLSKLISFGYSESSKLVSENMIIPLIYYRYRTNCDFNESDVKKYIALSIINGVYRSSSDTVTTNIISSIQKDIDKKNISEVFTLNWLIKLADKEEGGVKFKANKEGIEDIVDKYKKESAEVTGILHILYSGLTDRYDYHEDHMHAKALLKSKEEIRKKFSNIDEKEIDEIKSKRDKLPNLQILTEQENLEKSDMELDEWVEKGNNMKLLKYCDGIKSFKLEDFNNFYAKRRENIINELCRILGVTY